MSRDAFDVPTVLEHQLRPALVLDSRGTVIAANKGSCRLILPSHVPASQSAHNVLLGKTVSDLGLVPLPGDPPILWTWSEILRAALDAAQSDKINRDTTGDRDPDATIDVLQDTDDFWDEEAEQQAIVETDVYVTRYIQNPAAHKKGELLKSSSMIKARATVFWLPQRENGHFLITFNRTSLPAAAVPTPSTLLAEPVSHLFGASETPQVFTCRSCRKRYEKSYTNPPANIEDATPDEPDVASSIIPFMMATLNTDGQVINLSKSWYRFSGLNEAGSLGDGWLHSMHPSDVEEATQAWNEVLRTGRSHWTHQARYRKDADGSYCWFLIRAQSYKDDKGNVMRWYASMMDINEWVMARLEADRRRHVMLTLFSQTDVMLWGIDKSFSMYICEGQLDWDPTIIAKLLKQGGEQQIGAASGTKNVTSRAELFRTVRAVIQGEAFNPIVEHWEGERYFRTRFVAERATFGGSVQAALALTFDITDEQARTALRVENQRLVNNEKMASDANKLRGRFLANMSHEIRTPISGIIGLSEHLLDCGLTEEQLEFASSILESAKFLLTIINDVLDFSKIESGHMDVESIPFSPYKLISDVVVPLRLQAKEKGLALTSNCDLQSDIVLLGDAWRMRQILTNLVGNSLKFTHEGHVDLTVRTIEHDEPGFMVVQFSVRDTGVGIDQDVMKALFKPFQQADSSTARLHGGTGLGLVICRQLVELMGGKIALESSPGQGTTAICDIPFPVHDGPVSGVLTATALPRRARVSQKNHNTNEKEPRKRAGSAPTDTKESGASSLSPSFDPEVHVLLVEDNPINRKVIALAIKKLGYTVSTACDGQEALHFLSKDSTRPKPAAVLMDCQMPNIDGYEATRRIRRDSDMFDEQTRRLPIIALTASAIKGDREACWAAGMDDYLTKPAAKTSLERTLSRWTAAERPQELGHNNSPELRPGLKNMPTS
ncbi:hypothetical protein CC86DRAFT_408909 [Ophiobolus disseminans]|uniref:Uncharacterized protein n=1 Tax=Ophiobolus disseminans TaxID=1469910 RepID=A0A6A6ZS27_9PLEO|nr:hypothetical protein CC86DRAFT_408909 [Ophiobolus disseminans]